jgi:hypothetical protein
VVRRRLAHRALIVVHAAGGQPPSWCYKAGHFQSHTGPARECEFTTATAGHGDYVHQPGPHIWNN